MKDVSGTTYKLWVVETELNWIYFCVQDPDERLTILNTRFERIYAYFQIVMKIWIFITIILPSMLSILMCFIVHRKFDVEYIYHPFEIRCVNWLMRFFINHYKSYLLTFTFSLPWNQTTPLGYFGEICFVILNQVIFWIILNFQKCWRVLSMNLMRCMEYRRNMIRFENWLIFIMMLKGNVN